MRIMRLPGSREGDRRSAQIAPDRSRDKEPKWASHINKYPALFYSAPTPEGWVAAPEPRMKQPDCLVSVGVKCGKPQVSWQPSIVLYNILSLDKVGINSISKTGFQLSVQLSIKGLQTPLIG